MKLLQRWNESLQFIVRKYDVRSKNLTFEGRQIVMCNAAATFMLKVDTSNIWIVFLIACNYTHFNCVKFILMLASIEGGSNICLAMVQTLSNKAQTQESKFA